MNWKEYRLGKYVENAYQMKTMKSNIYGGLMCKCYTRHSGRTEGYLFWGIGSQEINSILD